MIRVYAASHVPAEAPPLPYISHVQTGAADRGICHHVLRDDTGDNISARNRRYCELTVLYWIWKNTLDECVGLCHYRRLFSPVLMPAENRTGAAVPRDIAAKLLTCDPSGGIFATEAGLCDMIVPARDPRPRSAAEMYARHHRASDWSAMMRAMGDLYPDEAEAARAFFDTAHPLHYYNMFIARRPSVEAYCAWLFPLLFRVEASIVPAEDPYQERVFGFLAERLFNWWTASRGMRLVERPIIQIVA